jgi:hypothetical protein
MPAETYVPAARIRLRHLSLDASDERRRAAFTISGSLAGQRPSQTGPQPEAWTTTTRNPLLLFLFLGLFLLRAEATSLTLQPGSRSRLLMKDNSGTLYFPKKNDRCASLWEAQRFRIQKSSNQKPEISSQKSTA